ncbi:MAG: ThuA domain-containing protein [Saprospiraceae bacterium]|nr:ThuA domain-containing protein [Saprospiraceae bacterium]
MQRRTFIYQSALAGAGALYLAGAACQSGEQAGRLTGRKVLFVYGGWELHQPEACRDLYVPWMQAEGAEVVVADQLDVYADQQLMEGIDLIVQTWTMGTIGDQAVRGLIDAVARGAGIAGWHGGLADAFRDRPGYQFMIGGQWVAHPGGYVPYTVQIIDPEDPVTAGINDFSLNTEQYYMHVDPNNKVLATTRFNGDHASWIDGCTMPVVWKRMHGAGRVFFSAIGHKMEDHTVAEAMTIMQRGIIWASQSKDAGPDRWKQPVYPAS